MRGFDLDPPLCEDAGAALLETLPWWVGALDLEPLQFALDNSFLKWRMTGRSSRVRNTKRGKLSCQ